MSEYQLWLDDDAGQRLTHLQGALSFEYVISQGEVGALSLTLPDSIDDSLLMPDRLIEVWRKPDSGTLVHERTYIYRKDIDRTDAQGKRTIQITGLDGNYLLKGREIMATIGSTDSDRTDDAADLMESFAVITMTTSSTSADRAWPATQFSVAPGNALGPNLTGVFGKQNALTVCKQIYDASWAKGTPTYFHVNNPEPHKFRLEYYVNQPGDDHTSTGGYIPLVFSLERGNLSEPVLERDYTDEVNAVYVLGEEDGDVELVVDSEREGRSLWSRREAVINANNETSTNGYERVGQYELGKRRPKLRFTAKIESIPDCEYGLHWRWGDKVTVEYRGRVFNCIVRAVKVAVDENGLERIDARLEWQETYLEPLGIGLRREIPGLPGLPSDPDMPDKRSAPPAGNLPRFGG